MKMSKYMGLTGLILSVIGLLLLALYGIQFFGTPPLNPHYLGYGMEELEFQIKSGIFTCLGAVATIIGFALMMIYSKFRELEEKVKKLESQRGSRR